MLAVIALILSVTATLWMAYEMWRAPLLDDRMNVIRKEKTLRDLFKSNKTRV